MFLPRVFSAPGAPLDIFYKFKHGLTMPENAHLMKSYSFFLFWAFQSACQKPKRCIIFKRYFEWTATAIPPSLSVQVVVFFIHWKLCSFLDLTFTTKNLTTTGNYKEFLSNSNRLEINCAWNLWEKLFSPPNPRENLLLILQSTNWGSKWVTTKTFTSLNSQRQAFHQLNLLNGTGFLRKNISTLTTETFTFVSQRDV